MRINLFNLIKGVSRTIDLVNPRLFSHHRDVALASLYLAEELGLSRQDKEKVIIASMLHDIGAFNLKTRLKTLKFEERDVEQHALMGAKLLSDSTLFSPFCKIILHHHTDWEKHTDIEDKSSFFLSNIVNIADRFSILVSKRKDYSEKKDILKVIKGGCPSRFDKSLCDALEAVTEKDIFWFQLNDEGYAFLDEERFYDKVINNKKDIDALCGLVSAITDFRSHFTAIHSSTIARFASFMSKKMNHSVSDVDCVRLSGYFHDIGKLAVPNELIEKRASLSAEEFFVVKRHIYHTFNLLKEINGFEEVTKIASRHHERLDGSGYPFRLKEKDLSVAERIMAVCDVFTAMKEDRPYRKGMNDADILKILNEMVRNKKLDGEVFGTLCSNLDEINHIFITQKKLCLTRYRALSDNQ